MKKVIAVAAFVSAVMFEGFAMTAEETIASTLWHEARGEGADGIRAVASVIVNRSKKSGKTCAYECLKPKQFSCWNGRAHVVPAKAKGKVWEFCKKVAHDIVCGQFKTTNNATHYYNFHLCNPSWGRKMRDVAVVGNHRFGRV